MSEGKREAEAALKLRLMSEEAREKIACEKRAAELAFEYEAASRAYLRELTRYSGRWQRFLRFISLSKAARPIFRAPQSKGSPPHGGLHVS